MVFQSKAYNVHNIEQCHVDIFQRWLCKYSSVSEARNTHTHLHPIASVWKGVCDHACPRAATGTIKERRSAVCLRKCLKGQLAPKHIHSGDVNKLQTQINLEGNISTEKEDLLVNILQQEKQFCFVAIESLFVEKRSAKCDRENEAKFNLLASFSTIFYCGSQQ